MMCGRRSRRAFSSAARDSTGTRPRPALADQFQALHLAGRRHVAEPVRHAAGLLAVARGPVEELVVEVVPGPGQVEARQAIRGGVPLVERLLVLLDQAEEPVAGLA